MKPHVLPLDFHLRDANDESVLILGQARDMRLEIRNTSPHPLHLNELTQEHHFSLRFRSGVLGELGQIKVSKAGRADWHVDTRQDEHGDVLVQLRHKTLTIWKAEHKLKLVLEGLKADVAGGTRATRVELDYGHIREKDESGQILAGRPLHQQMVLTMPVSHEGLFATHFTGATGNVVVNDGLDNRVPIELRLTNLTAHEIHIGDGAEFHVVLAGGLKTEPGALATHEALGNCTLEASLTADGLEEAPTPLICLPVSHRTGEWTIRAPENTALSLQPAGHVDMPAGHVDIQIGGIATAHPNGPSDVYVGWENLICLKKPVSGSLVQAVQKSPLVVSDRRVGIGTAQPQAALDVHGDMKIRGRIEASAGLHVDALLKANQGVVLGGVTLVAPTQRLTRTTHTEPRHFTADEFEAFEGWPTSLTMLEPLSFEFPFPHNATAMLAARASVRLHVFAEPVGAPGGRCMDFASMPIAGLVTVNGRKLNVEIDLGPVVTVSDIPVQTGVRTLQISGSILPGSPAEMERWRTQFAELSVIAGDWAHTFGRKGPKVRWTIDTACALTALFAEIADPS